MIFVAALLLAGCRTLPQTLPPLTLAEWQAVARERNLAGESASRFSHWHQLAKNDRRRQELPDLINLAKNSPPEKSAELSLNILREAVAIASVIIVPANDSANSPATQIAAGELDCQTAVMLTEKAMLDAGLWQPETAAARAALDGEIAALLGEVPESDSVDLVMPHAITPTPMPHIIAENLGSDPEALIKFANIILAMPGEFARRLISDPQAKISGIWQEACRHAALAMTAITEQQLADAFAVYQRDPSPQNLCRFRKWFYRRRQALSALPLVNGSTEDIRDLEALVQLHNYL